MLPEKAYPVNTCPLVVVPSSSLSCHQTIRRSVQYKHSVIRMRQVFFCQHYIYTAVFSANYATAAYHAAALSAKHVTAAYHAMQHSQSCNGSISCNAALSIMQWQHSQSRNGSVSCSSILNAIALSHYEFLILLLPAIYA